MYKRNMHRRLVQTTVLAITIALAVAACGSPSEYDEHKSQFTLGGGSHIEGVPPTPTPALLAFSSPPTNHAAPTLTPNQDIPDEQPPDPSAISFQISSVENLLEFNKNHLTVKTSGQVTVKLDNPSTALQHNWVLVRAGTEDSVAAAGTAAGPANGWTPNDDHNVIAHTALLDPGASGEVTFPVPPPGIYAFVCTFPGHGTAMRGVFEVTD